MIDILIIDDDEGDRKLIRRAIKQSGGAYDVQEASDVQSALEICDSQLPDCAILDYRMPGLDGLQGILTLQHKYPYMAIIMSTGQGDEIIASEAMKRGASDYIPKKLLDAQTVSRCIENATEKATLKRKLDEQREELQFFARVLVHDLKAPIRSIHRFAVFVEEEIKNGNVEKATRDCNIIARSAERMSQFIDTIHEYTQLDRDVSFDNSMDMEQLVRDIRTNLRIMLEDTEARITNDSLPTITGNAPQLTQLLQNLVSNGIKYSKQTSPTVHISSSEDSSNWHFSVEDNGIGIPEKFHTRIFDPFTRLHSESEYPGSGLGLTICQKIIQRHGGEIWCESSINEGSTFYFTIPKPESAR